MIHQCKHPDKEKPLKKTLQKFHCRYKVVIKQCYVITSKLNPYPRKRSPREGRQRTKHHFAWCIRGQIWSQEPSTLEGDVPVVTIKQLIIPSYALFV